MPNNWLMMDLDYALADARFTDSDPAGNHIPGAVKWSEIFKDQHTAEELSNH
jgi:hypothetical protein